ncbi:MAG: hypothetical protein IT443_04680 [Phycisphaeraceae bacterium]|nr:hypothetical protein [Phycisphaeraceae bacterium]
MTTPGTGVAAGVAGAPLQAQQLGRSQDVRRSAETKRMREVFESHLRSLEEGDEDQSPDQLHIDNHLPQHSNQSPYQEPGKQNQPKAEKAPEEPADAADSPPQASPPQDDRNGLYRHLDVQA